MKEKLTVNNLLEASSPTSALLAKARKVATTGMIGLDGYFENENDKNQIVMFLEEQLEPDHREKMLNARAKQPPQNFPTIAHFITHASNQSNLIDMLSLLRRQFPDQPSISKHLDKASFKFIISQRIPALLQNSPSD